MCALLRINAHIKKSANLYIQFSFRHLAGDKGEFMKDTQINIRISSKDMDLIKRTAALCNFKKVSKFIMAVLIPYCCKVESTKNKVD